MPEEGKNGPSGKEFGELLGAVKSLQAGQEVLSHDVRRLYDRVESYHAEAQRHIERCPNTTPLRELDRRVDKVEGVSNRNEERIIGIRRGAATIAAVISLLLGFLGFLFSHVAP